MDMQIRIPFHIQKNTFDFASTISTIEPSNASVNPSDSMTIKIKCIISWSTEEKEEVYKKEKEKRKCFELPVEVKSQIFSIKNTPLLSHNIQMQICHLIY